MKIKLYDTPPDGRANIDWSGPDEVMLTLIDNPGKWAHIHTQTQRSTTNIKARYGKGFAIRTHANENNEIEVWASYHGEE